MGLLTDVRTEDELLHELQGLCLALDEDVVGPGASVRRGSDAPRAPRGCGDSSAADRGDSIAARLLDTRGACIAHHKGVLLAQSKLEISDD